MKVVADIHIPYLRGVLEPYAEVMYLEPKTITNAVLRDADALLVRTYTKCNKTLLNGTSVRFIGTGTIGFDHIDTAYCAAHGITWKNAPGCNAQGVCDWVEMVLQEFHSSRVSKFKNPQLTLGIVGVGNVGSKVWKMAERLGYKVLLNDPPKGIGIPLQELAKQADIITFHTPLDASTYHLCDEELLNLMKPNALIINAARGGIIDENAVKTQHLAIDCWEGEPHINLETLRKTDIATYHIAGYTKLGKWNATKAILEGLCAYFHLPQLLPNAPQPESQREFDIILIDKELRAHPEQFLQLREAYRLR